MASHPGTEDPSAGTIITSNGADGTVSGSGGGGAVSSPCGIGSKSQNG